MIIALNPDVPFEYSFKSDTGELKTIILIKSLTVEDFNWYLVNSQKVSEIEGKNELPIEFIYDVLNRFVVGWRNFYFSDNIEVPFMPGTSNPRHNWKYFTISQLMELFQAIIEVNKLEAVIEKNSESGHLSQGVNSKSIATNAPNGPKNEDVSMVV